mmetsp:Transcript_32503/g.75537  ORF Transcript_32503/g.75537 Transcript_32503/m.75537 type:complete len:210 (-) Transcript_32503:332-961(-)
MWSCCAKCCLHLCLGMSRCGRHHTRATITGRACRSSWMGFPNCWSNAGTSSSTFPSLTTRCTRRSGSAGHSASSARGVSSRSGHGAPGSRKWSRTIGTGGTATTPWPRASHPSCQWKSVRCSSPCRRWSSVALGSHMPPNGSSSRASLRHTPPAPSFGTTSSSLACTRLRMKYSGPRWCSTSLASHRALAACRGTSIGTPASLDTALRH